MINRLIKTVIMPFNIILIIFLFFIFYSVNLKAQEEIEEKYYCQATIEDEFADDSILIVLNQTASLSSKVYDLNDFSEYGCIKVIDLTQ